MNCVTRKELMNSRNCWRKNDQNHSQMEMIWEQTSCKRNGCEKMIFSEEHIEKIKKGTKTQTRRVNRGNYRVGKDYAVQSGRGKMGIQGLRIVIDEIRRETKGFPQFAYPTPISHDDAWNEGGYTPETFEELFRLLNPKWNGLIRWAFKFHVKEVQSWNQKNQWKFA